MSAEIYEPARLFWVVEGADLEEAPEIFDARHEADKYAEKFGKHEPYRISIAEVRNYYRETNGSWNYDDYSDTFTPIITIVTQTDTRSQV